MKKSAQVPATLIIAIAASLSTNGCRGSSSQCVDYAGRVLPNSACGGSGTGYYGGHYYGGAHWVHTGGFGTTGYGGGYGG